MEPTTETLIEKAEKFLALCGPCDAGLPGECACPWEDFRPTMLALVEEVKRLREIERERVGALYKVVATDTDHRGRVGWRTAVRYSSDTFFKNAQVFTIKFPEGDSVELWEWQVVRVEGKPGVVHGGGG